MNDATSPVYGWPSTAIWSTGPLTGFSGAFDDGEGIAPVDRLAPPLNDRDRDLEDARHVVIDMRAQHIEESIAVGDGHDARGGAPVVAPVDRRGEVLGRGLVVGIFEGRDDPVDAIHRGAYEGGFVGKRDAQRLEVGVGHIGRGGHPVAGPPAASLTEIEIRYFPSSV